MLNITPEHYKQIQDLDDVLANNGFESNHKFNEHFVEKTVSVLKNEPAGYGPLQEMMDTIQLLNNTLDDTRLELDRLKIDVEYQRTVNLEADNIQEFNRLKMQISEKFHSGQQWDKDNILNQLRNIY